MDLDSDHPEFDDDSRWPRRLLHVRTMTSYKWEPGNKYAGYCEPDYVALSYTWGRYRLRDGESPQVKPIQIRGIPWKIPRVNPLTHFSVAEFQHVIAEVVKKPDREYVFDEWKRRAYSRGDWLWRRFFEYLERTIPHLKFLWLDIACIDQRETPTGMLEIGRQARIFRHARYSYVWLSHLPHTKLQNILFSLGEAKSGLQGEPFHQEPLVFDSEPWLRQALTALSELSEDPWFSSLWTLQEAFLCNQAIIMSQDGKLIPDASVGRFRGWPLDLLFLYTNDIIIWSERTRTNKESQSFRLLMEAVRKTGLGALWYNTPMALLGVSRYRTTTRELDRVYGIMQAFGTNFSVGNSRPKSDQTRKYTLDELEDELGATILETYPILSQMHVYLEPPAHGKGWCVRGNSDVPFLAERGDMFGWDSGQRLYGWGSGQRPDTALDIRSHTLCRFSTQKVEHNLWARVSGQACDFKTLKEAWKEVDQSEHAKLMLNSGWRMHLSASPSTQMIALDRGTGFLPSSPELDILNVRNKKDELIQHDLAQEIANKDNGNKLKVLLLGCCGFGNESANAAVIVLQLEVDRVRYWHRIGICLWLISHLSINGHDHHHKKLLYGESDDWHHIEGLFG